MSTNTYTQITKIQISTFIFNDDIEGELHICSTCATRLPELNAYPITFTYDLFHDAYSPLCYHCGDPIIALNDEAD